MKPKVYIDGKEGTTGLQIYERLGGRTDIELLLIDEDKRKDVSERKKLIEQLEAKMRKAAQMLEYEIAAQLRDEIIRLRGEK